SIAEDTSYQYATVAAMTLRYFGIPSRYVEGYVITEEMAENAEDGSSIKVDSYKVIIKNVQKVWNKNVQML
ncbi:MAG: transglutaminase domain-containing protein, partial [Agathobacter sp.]|nr:transglutaminase domain-containing protein [Agathobacter sp.]